MKRKTVIILAVVTLLASGCGNHSKKKSDKKASASPKVSESSEPEKTAEPEQTSQPTTGSETAAQGSGSSVQPDAGGSSSADISGNYLIVSYDNGSGEKETFDPGNDDSIIGSSSIVLNKDGSCEYNMPGVGENTSCTWSGNTLQAAGAETQFSISGNNMTVQQNGETYVFEKK